MTAPMEEMDAVPLDFLKSYSEDEAEGILPKFGGERVKVPSVSPDQVTSIPIKVEDNASEAQPKRKRRSPKVPWKKPKDMPRRPLSAYNLFFQREREQMVKNSRQKQAASNNDPTRSSPIADSVPSSNSTRRGSRASQGRRSKNGRSTGIGFANLAKTIAAKWKQIDSETRAEFETMAAVEKERYNKEMVVWRNKKKIEKEISEKTRSIDEELRSSMLEVEPNLMTSSSEPSTFTRRASLMTSSEPSNFTRPTFMRRLSDPYPETSHSMELFRHHRQHMFNSSFTRACLAQMMQASLNNTEAPIEPLNLPSLNNSLNSIEFELENTFQEEPSDALRTFSDSILDDRLYDIRPCEDIVAEVASMRSEQQKQQPLPIFGAAQSSLRALGTTLDDDTVDFLTQLKFEA